jgi:hypothetical protein
MTANVELAFGPEGSAARARATAALRWCPFWVAMLLLTLALPTEFSFHLGSLRLTPYRLVLIATFVPCLLRLLSGQAGPLRIVDTLMFAHIGWCFIVIAVHHGEAVALESGGIRMLEVLGAYLIARVYVTDERSFRGMLAVAFLVLVLIAPLVVLESLTGFHLIKEVAARIMGVPFYSGIDQRFGLSRAFGPFDHPILLGVFAASMVGVSWMTALPRLGQPRRRRLPTLAAVAGAMVSLSSGALAALSIQLCLLLWERFTRGVAGRWKILTGLFVAAYTAVDLLSNRSGYHVFLHYLTFSAHTAYNRIIIFQTGIQDVWRNPLFGIGFNVWSKPSWMHSDSMDNFWLVQAVTFGIPGFLTLALAVILALAMGWGRLPPRLTRLRMGWVISMIGIIVAACTVHLWNNIFVYFMLLFGGGLWFLNANRCVSGREDLTPGGEYGH